MLLILRYGLVHPAAHAAGHTTGHSAALFLGQVGDHHFRREHKARHGGGVLERGARDLGRVDDARLERVRRLPPTYEIFTISPSVTS